MCRIICHTARLDEHSTDDYHPFVNVKNVELPLIDSIDQLVRHLETESRYAFRCADFEGIEVHWQRVGPTAAQVYEYRREKLLRLHQLSRGPTGEVWWVKYVRNDVQSDASDLLSLILIVPAFAEWSHQARIAT